MESLRGRLLIAGAGMLDPNFRRTIVLVAEHTPEGALGVVLNRPTEVAVGRLLPELEALVGPEAMLHLGGPVQPEAAVVLADFEDPDQAGLLAFGSVGFLMGQVAADVIGGIRRARVFAGYAGWGPGQLEREMQESAWIPEPPHPEDPFTVEPENLWARVLRRKGREFAILALMPRDPSMN